MWWLPWNGLAHRPQSPSPSAGPAHRTLSECSMYELVMRWSASRTALVQASTTAEALALVTLRAAMLDELERRDPRGFWVWVEEEQRRLRPGL